MQRLFRAWKTRVASSCCLQEEREQMAAELKSKLEEEMTAELQSKLEEQMVAECARTDLQVDKKFEEKMNAWLIRMQQFQYCIRVHFTELGYSLLHFSDLNLAILVGGGPRTLCKRVHIYTKSAATVNIKSDTKLTYKV